MTVLADQAHIRDIIARNKLLENQLAQTEAKLGACASREATLREHVRDLHHRLVERDRIIREHVRAT